MPKQYFEIGGINTYQNPISQDGQLIHSVNMTSFPYGAKTKRTGYSAFLGTANGSAVQSLFAFPRNDGTALTLYRKSGAIIYHSVQGTGAWTISGNGTVDASAHVGAAILDNTLIVGDGVGSTRHSTNGTSFTNTTLAPVSPFFEQYQNRIYASGTAGDLFYSTTNNAADWATSGTSDSSSFKIPGQGKNSQIFKTGDRLIITKNSGAMYKWDGYSLVDMTTKYGPSSPYSIGDIEDARFFVNRYGAYVFDGSRPKLISNAIQRQFYNEGGTGIAGTAFATIPGVCHRYDYYASVGSFTDDFTDRTFTNGIIKYDFQKNEFLNYDMAHKPSSWLSYTDATGSQQLIFGNASGQCYKLDGTYTDAGSAITAELLFVFNFGAPEYEKKWNWWRGFFNPGCQAKVQIACSDTYTYTGLRWQELGDTSDGEVEFRFPQNSRSRLLFVKIYESSSAPPFTFYGQSLDAQVQQLL